MVGRGQISHPINWILVLIGGLFFLLLFFAIAKSMIRGSENAVELHNYEYLKSIVDSSQGDPSTINEFNLPSFKTLCDNGYGVIIGDELIDFSEFVIFSPETLGGDTILASHLFSFPYPVVSISYLFPKNGLVLFDNKLPNVLFDSLDKVYAVKRYDSFSEVDVSGYNPVVVVSENSLSGVLEKNSDQQVFGISVSPNNNDPLGSGLISFYKYDGGFTPWNNGADIPYFSKALFLGAVAATTPARYKCAVNSVQKRLKLITEINKKRLNKLTYNNQCNTAKNEIQSAFDTVINNNMVDKNSLNDFVTAANTISEWNSVLRRNNCAIVY